MSIQDANESVAMMMVSQFARVTLYPTETPRVQPEVMVSVMTDGASFTLLKTNLPDDVIYLVYRETLESEPLLSAYRKLTPDDLTVHN